MLIKFYSIIIIFIIIHRFSCDDKHLISIGGQDRTILVWETDVNEVKDDEEQLDVI